MRHFTHAPTGTRYVFHKRDPLTGNLRGWSMCGRFKADFPEADCAFINESRGRK
jgi:aldehyde:ferredoxin oxidoreductase